jgi:fucose permease
VLLAIALLAFVSLGLPDGVLGVAWPSIRRSFGLPPGQLGSLLASAMVGYLVSSFSSGALVARLGVGRLLLWSSVLMVVNAFAYALAPAWSVMVAAGLLAGLGAGAIDAGINAYASLHLGPRLLNWLHACWGLGAASGPVIMTALLQAGRPWQSGYRRVGLAQLVLAAAFAVTARAWSESGTEDGGALGRTAVRAAPAASTLRRAATWLGGLTFFVYTGLEGSIGVWSYTLLTEGRGVSGPMAGASVSAFFAGLTGGRLLAAVATGSVPVRSLLRGCLLAIAAAAALLAANVSHVASFAAVALAGFACGPVFPSLMSTTPARLGNEHVTSGVGLQVAAAAAGAAILPATVGVVARRVGLESVGALLLAMALASFALQEALSRYRRDS